VELAEGRVEAGTGPPALCLHGFPDSEVNGLVVDFLAAR
jgi:hypothetical protein